MDLVYVFYRFFNFYWDELKKASIVPYIFGKNSFSAKWEKNAKHIDSGFLNPSADCSDSQIVRAYRRKGFDTLFPASVVQLSS
jgi:hypothetical protein